MAIILSHSTAYFLLHKGCYIKNPIKKKIHTQRPSKAEIAFIKGLFSEQKFPINGEPLDIFFFSKNCCKDSKDIQTHYWNESNIQPIIYPLCIDGEIINNVYITSPQSTFLELIDHLNKYEILKLVYEMTGNYITFRNDKGEQDFDMRKSPLCTLDSLVALINQDGIGKINGIGKAKKVIRYALPNAYSPMETTAALMLTLPNCWGGEAIPAPELNLRIDLSIPEQRELGQSYIMSDMVWSNKKIVLEYDSLLNHNFLTKPKQVYKDKRRANMLTQKGYKVLSLDVGDFVTESRIAELSKYLLELLGRYRLIRCRNFGYKHSMLFHELMNPNPWC